MAGRLYHLALVGALLVGVQACGGGSEAAGGPECGAPTETTAAAAESGTEVDDGHAEASPEDSTHGSEPTDDAHGGEEPTVETAAPLIRTAEEVVEEPTEASTEEPTEASTDEPTEEPTESDRAEASAESAEPCVDTETTDCGTASEEETAGEPAAETESHDEPTVHTAAALILASEDTSSTDEPTEETDAAATDESDEPDSAEASVAVDTTDDPIPCGDDVADSVPDPIDDPCTGAGGGEAHSDASGAEEPTVDTAAPVIRAAEDAPVEEAPVEESPEAAEQATETTVEGAHDAATGEPTVPEHSSGCTSVDSFTDADLEGIGELGMQWERGQLISEMAFAETADAGSDIQTLADQLGEADRQYRELVEELLLDWGTSVSYDVPAVEASVDAAALQLLAVASGVDFDRLWLQVAAGHLIHLASLADQIGARTTNTDLQAIAVEIAASSRTTAAQMVELLSS